MSTAIFAAGSTAVLPTNFLIKPLIEWQQCPCCALLNELVLWLKKKFVVRIPAFVVPRMVVAKIDEQIYYEISTTRKTTRSSSRSDELEIEKHLRGLRRNALYGGRVIRFSSHQARCLRALKLR